MDNDEYDLFSISSPKNGKIVFSFEKTNNSKYKKNKAYQKLHEKLNIQISNKKRYKKMNDFDKFLIMNNQLHKHNSTPAQKNIMIINDIIDTKTNHFLAKFKDFLISDYVDEFLKRYFTTDECEELIPKFFLYYKNYLKFFCRGFFADFKANKIIQDNGEFQAELYYNNNYGAKEDRKRKKTKEEKISEHTQSESKSEISQDNKNNNSNISKINSFNKIKLIFSKSIRKKLGGVETSRMQEKKEISNILYKNKNETLTLNNETKIYNEDNIYTNENSLINLLNELINKKLSRKKLNPNKIVKHNINEKNIVNIYKNLLSQSPMKSARYQNYIKNGIYNKTSKKVSSIKIFNKNIPIIFKNKNHNLSNDMKIPFLDKTKMTSRNNQSRNSRTNFSSRANNSTNIFIKNSKSKKGHKKRKNNSRSILTQIKMGNFASSKLNKSKYSNFNKNIINKKRKKSIYTGFYFKNMSNNSSNSSRSLKKNFIGSFHSNNNNNNNNQKINNKIKHYQYMNFKNKATNRNKIQNKIYRHKQNWSLSNSNSIYNNFHININNNIMLLNNNNNNSNIRHLISNKNNMKLFSKNKNNNGSCNINNNNNNIKNNIFNYKRNNKNINSRNQNIIDINKYKTEIKNMQLNSKKKSNNNNKNIYSSNSKFMSLEKSKSKNKDKNFKNKEPLVRNKSNLYYNNIRFKIKKFEKSEMMFSLKNAKKLNNSNKNLKAQNGQKINIIFDYKKK